MLQYIDEMDNAYSALTNLCIVEFLSDEYKMRTFFQNLEMNGIGETRSLVSTC